MRDHEGYGFYFEEEGLAGHQGPINPSEEYFKHRQLEKALAREMIQNSLDAKLADAKCITVHFQLERVSANSIPGIDDLRHASKSAWESNKTLQGADSLKVACDSANAKGLISVLRIGDYNTRGLTGSESIDDPTSPLSALTRGSGVSSSDDSRGGSFGIGSAVGFAASRMRTVAYISKPWNADPVFAASARFASHKDREGRRRVPWGYFTDLKAGRDGNFGYLRNPGAFPGFDSRTEPGTDVFVLDYLRAKNDPGLVMIREAVIEDFMVAIHKGRLRVIGRGKESWELSAETLDSFIRDSEHLRQSTLPYYVALTKGTFYPGELPSIGRVKLYTHIDPERPAGLRSGTQLMRSPLMRVATIHHRFNTPYAAVFICDDPKGNAILRGIEPPTHDEWSEKGARSNEKVVKEIKRFVREKLADGMKKEFGQELTIKGLENRLPVLSLASLTKSAPRTAQNSRPSGNAPHIQESSVRLGVTEESAVIVRNPVPVGLSVVKNGVATPDGQLPGSRGNRSGNGSSPHEPVTGIRTKGEQGEGRSRIKSREVSFRSFFNKELNAHVVTVRAESPIDGDLEIAGFGAGGTQFDLPIASASMQSPGSRSLNPVQVEGATIKGVKAEQGETKVFVIRFRGDGRYRIGVSDD